MNKAGPKVRFVHIWRLKKHSLFRKRDFLDSAHKRVLTALRDTEAHTNHMPYIGASLHLHMACLAIFHSVAPRRIRHKLQRAPRRAVAYIVHANAVGHSPSSPTCLCSGLGPKHGSVLWLENARRHRVAIHRTMGETTAHYCRRKRHRGKGHE